MSTGASFYRQEHAWGLGPACWPAGLGPGACLAGPKHRKSRILRGLENGLFCEVSAEILRISGWLRPAGMGVARQGEKQHIS